MKSRLNKAYSVLALTLLIIPVCFGQNSEIIKDQSLKNQYNQMIDKAETYSEYKVIKKDRLDAFWLSVQDSVQLLINKHGDAKTTINSQAYNIEELKESITQKDNLVLEAEFEKEHISVLGIEFNKRFYSVTSLIIYVVLLAFGGLLITRVKATSQITRIAKANLKEVENEFEIYKKNALDKQMKLKRELQTERNKLTEMSR